MSLKTEIFQVVKRKKRLSNNVKETLRHELEQYGCFLACWSAHWCVAVEPRMPLRCVEPLHGPIWDFYRGSEQCFVSVSLSTSCALLE